MVKQIDVELLSSAPWFDVSTAGDLLLLARKAVTPPEIDEILTSLSRTGLLVRRLEAWRVAEPLRTELRQSLAGQNRELYDEAIRTFARHARNGFGPQLAAIMGEHGADLNVRAVAASVQDGEAFNDLVSYVDRVATSGRTRDAFVAADLVELYSGTIGRRSEFLRGLGLWNQGNRVAAESAFDSVRATYRLDRAGAISNHLLGIIRYQRGDYVRAVELLDDAITDLRLMKDADGLCVTLTTLGRVLKDRHRDMRVPADLVRAREVLEEALELSQSPRSSVSVRLALAQVEQADGDIRAAIALAEQANVDAVGMDQLFDAAISLAALYRRDDRDSDAVDVATVLEDRLGRAHLPDIKYARLLNVTAAAERKLRRFSDAERHALRSVEIGRRLGDQRHVAHALHTLASIAVDSLSADPKERMRQAREIRSQLAEAQGILASLHNTSGVEMIERTSARLFQTLAELAADRVDMATEQQGDDGQYGGRGHGRPR